MLTDFSLEGKVAIITGSSKGIGEAIAYKFGQAGAKVVISSRKQAADEEVAESFQKDGIDAIAIACNTSSPSQIRSLIHDTVAKYGGLDIVVNNAATNPYFGSIIDAELGMFEKIMDVNLEGPWLLSKFAYPELKARGGGSIINIGSIEGITPSPNLGIYSISKSALNMLTKVLAKELGKDNIRVNCICPGYIKTKLSEKVFDDEILLNEVMGNQCIDYKAEPEDIAGIALLLASKAGAFFTGAILTADGGYTV